MLTLGGLRGGPPRVEAEIEVQIHSKFPVPVPVRVPSPMGGKPPVGKHSYFVVSSLERQQVSLHRAGCSSRLSPAWAWTKIPFSTHAFFPVPER